MTLSNWIHPLLFSGGADPYADYLMYDSYTGVNGEALADHVPEKGGPYSEQNGVFEIQSNELAERSHSTNYVSAMVPAAADFDGIWEVFLNEVQASAGPFFRCGDAPPWAGSGWYLEIIPANAFRLANNNGGWGIKYNGVNPTSTGAHTIRIVCSGNSIKCYWDENLEIDITDAYGAANTYLGWFINHDQETTTPYSRLDSLVAE